MRAETHSSSSDVTAIIARLAATSAAVTFAALNLIRIAVGAVIGISERTRATVPSGWLIKSEESQSGTTAGMVTIAEI